MTEMPNWVIYTVGAMVLANVGTIITVIIAGAKMVAKATWYISKLDSRLEKNENDINAAHEKIRFNRSLLLKDGGSNGTTDS